MKMTTHMQSLACFQEMCERPYWKFKLFAAPPIKGFTQAPLTVLGKVRLNQLFKDVA